MDELKVAIQGIGLVGGFGSGAEELLSALQGRSIVPSQVSVETDEGPRQLPLYRADTSRLEEFFKKRELRRIDHYSRMTLLAASMALKDAGSTDHGDISTGIIVATGYGPHRTTFSFLDSFIKEGDGFSSPTQFANSVHNAAAAYAAILLREKGPSLTVSQFEMSVASALLTAVCWLKEGRVNRILFGAVDEYSDVLGYAWHRLLKEEAAPDMIRPLDFERQTAIPGEGSVFFVLSLAHEGASAKYGFLAPIFSGRDLHAANSTFFHRPTVIIGADGQRYTGSFYGDMVTKTENVRCFTPLYGSIPVGQAFDIAIAALASKGEGPALCVKCSNSGKVGVVSVIPGAEQEA